MRRSGKFPACEEQISWFCRRNTPYGHCSKSSIKAGLCLGPLFDADGVAPRVSHPTPAAPFQTPGSAGTPTNGELKSKRNGKSKRNDPENSPREIKAEKILSLPESDDRGRRLNAGLTTLLLCCSLYLLLQINSVQIFPVTAPCATPVVHCVHLPLFRCRCLATQH